MNERHKALKRFGQNYLIDNNIIRKIIKEFEPEASDYIIEIGPGLGIMTGALIESKAKIVAVEIDNRVIDNLKAKFPSVEVINRDFLKIDLKGEYEKAAEQLRIIGNIPYNITSPIIFKLIEQRDLIKDALFMVQYEVAKRMTSIPGTKDYGILGVILNYFGSVELCFKVPPTVFRPKPKVHSAVIKITFKNTPAYIDDKLFIKTVKAAFGNRRKNLKNSLSNSIFRNCNFDEIKVDLTKRAEQLSIEDFVILTKFFQDQINE